MKDVYAINRIHFAKRVESDNVSPPLLFFPTLRCRTNKVEVIPTVVDRGQLEVRGVDKQQQVSKCKGLPSKKQNLVLSKESTPMKDSGTKAPSCFLSGVDEPRKHGGCDSVVVDKGELEYSKIVPNCVPCPIVSH